MHRAVYIAAALYILVCLGLLFSSTVTKETSTLNTVTGGRVGKHAYWRGRLMFALLLIDLASRARCARSNELTMQDCYIDQ